MTIEICTVGGYNEVGKNMTAIRVDDEVVLIDMGLHLDPYIQYTDSDEVCDMSAAALTSIGAIPDIKLIQDWQKKVKAIIPTHAHLDHVGAVPYLERKFDAPILCTPFTAEVLKAICADEKIKLKNKVKVLNVNSIYTLSDKITLEFVNAAHSTPQTVLVAIHTPYGVILYASDFKFDSQPVIGKKTDMAQLKRLGKKNVLCLICDGTRAGQAMKTPSEQVAREMLKDVMLATSSEGKAVVVTTFSSHIARLKSIVEFGKKLNRKIVFLGRSLSKYVAAAENAGIIKFSDDVELVKFGKHIRMKLKQIEKNPAKYLIVCTGHQGEQKAVLGKIVNGEFEFRFNKDDQIIFSCTVIPTPLNRSNRDILERNLRQHGVRIFKDLHASGHPSKEDCREIISLVKPKHIIPCHVDTAMATGLMDLALEMGYTMGEQVHLMQNGQRFRVLE
ncbi:MAG: RNase J family beta-CASP ribonuclease [Candidatus Woesearchaeota archaeon]